MSKSALGRGLGALLGGNPSTPPASAPPAMPKTTPNVAPVAPSLPEAERLRKVPLNRIQPSSLQPRKDFSEETLKELSASIREKGILQPLLVRPRGENYELIAGERRWRAAQMLALAEVPIMVKEADDHTVLEMMLIENLQRDNLNPIEEAIGYEQLIQQYQLRQEDVASKVGKSRVAVANALRLLKLPGEVQSWVRNGLLSVGHAKAILSLERPEEQKLTATEVIKDGLSVRATEELVAHRQTHASGSAPPQSKAITAIRSRDAHVADLENRLQQRLGSKVQLRYRQGKGAVTIHFYDDNDLNRLLDFFSIKLD